MKQRRVTYAVLAAAIGGIPIVSWPCKCANVSDVERFCRTKNIFVAEVKEIGLGPSKHFPYYGRGAKAKARVVRTLKGGAAGDVELKVKSDEVAGWFVMSSCAWELEEHATYLVFADDEEVTVRACSGTRTISGQELNENEASRVVAQLSGGAKCP